MADRMGGGTHGMRMGIARIAVAIGRGIHRARFRAMMRLKLENRECYPGNSGKARTELRGLHARQVQEGLHVLTCIPLPATEARTAV